MLMKAVRLTKIGKPLEMQEIPLPSLGEQDVLVEVKAAGICHSDVHYRAGTSSVGPLPLTLGHEIAGIIKKAGFRVKDLNVGNRVCLHYQLSCSNCSYCRRGMEQFCNTGMMLGKHCDGGFAEYIAVPARNALILPETISFAQGAIMMCSSATSFHALQKAKLKLGERVAVFGAGGLGMSAIQLARVLGAFEVYAVDISEEKLRLAEEYGAIPINSVRSDPVGEILRRTDGRGVDVALELIGIPQTIHQAVQSLATFGRAVLVGITNKPFPVDSYLELIGKEAEIIGCADHLFCELPPLIELVRRGQIDLSSVVTNIIPLESEVINKTMDRMEEFGGGIRTVIRPSK